MGPFIHSLATLSLLLAMLLGSGKAESCSAEAPITCADTDATELLQLHVEKAVEQESAKLGITVEKAAAELDKAVDEAAANTAGIGEFSILVGDAQGIHYAKKGKEVDASGFAPSSFTKQQRIFSASKWLTTAALGAAIKSGVFSWDDRVGKYIKWWTKDPKDHRFDITFAHCLSHTSGLTMSKAFAKYVGIEELFKNADMGGLSEGQTLEETAQRIFTNTKPDIPKPPDAYRYGEVHYFVAQFAALQASGMNLWQDFFAKYLGIPLGLQPEIEDPEHETTKAYFKSGNPYAYGFHFNEDREMKQSHANNPDGGSAVVISPCAYSKFLVSYVSKGEQMWNANEVDKPRADVGEFWGSWGFGERYALGHWLPNTGPLTGIGHSIGFAGTLPMVIPGDKPFWIYVSRWAPGAAGASVELVASLIKDIKKFMGSSPAVDNSVCPL
mmetsp:Transcript_20325/g.36709  ORF Transcript_20325/g.36709 Transcript_20325/m.36709 type:complete len:442 (+) Transcript_20325:87-1412(+)